MVKVIYAHPFCCDAPTPVALGARLVVFEKDDGIGYIEPSVACTACGKVQDNVMFVHVLYYYEGLQQTNVAVKCLGLWGAHTQPSLLNMLVTREAAIQWLTEETGMPHS